MGCRTRANEYYATMSYNQMRVQQNKKTATVVEGNVVRKSAPEKADPVRVRRTRKKSATVSAATAFRKQRRLFVVFGAIGAFAVVLLSCLMLMTLEESSRLSDDIREKEQQLEELTVSNDAKKYEIDSSVDLQYVISVATEELGMVRSSLAQVVTYRTKDTEYLQQVARVPSD